MKTSATVQTERWRLLAMGWKHRCYEAGDTLYAIELLHLPRACAHGEQPHEPRRAPNGEVTCTGPTCRTCHTTAPCRTYTLARPATRQPPWPAEVTP